MNSHTINLVNFKNPTDVFKYCEKHNINSAIEDNSDIWCKLIEKNYNKYTIFKIKTLSYKDYYVLLYFIQCLNLLTDTFIITKTQEILSIISVIYEGDHIAIIHACNNLAVRNNKAKLLLYRDTDTQCTIPTYGSGYLKIKFINNTTDVYTNSINTTQYNKPFNSDLSYGGYNIL
jgi:hypothetical protein